MCGSCVCVCLYMCFILVRIYDASCNVVKGRWKWCVCKLSMVQIYMLCLHIVCTYGVWMMHVECLYLNVVCICGEYMHKYGILPVYSVCILWLWGIWVCMVFVTCNDGYVLSVV